MLADRKEDTGRAFVLKRLQNRWCIDRPRAVVEGEDDFLIAKEVELLEMFKAKTQRAPIIDITVLSNFPDTRVDESTAVTWKKFWPSAAVFHVPASLSAPKECGLEHYPRCSIVLRVAHWRCTDSLGPI